MNSILENDRIRFRLDGRWEGSGRVLDASGQSLVVLLDEPCKEFKVDDEIFVGRDEVIIS